MQKDFFKNAYCVLPLHFLTFCWIVQQGAHCGRSLLPDRMPSFTGSRKHPDTLPPRRSPPQTVAPAVISMHNAQRGNKSFLLNADNTANNASEWLLRIRRVRHHCLGPENQTKR